MLAINFKNIWSNGLERLLVPILSISVILIIVMAAYSYLRTPKFFEPDGQLLLASLIEANRKTQAEILDEVEVSLDRAYEPVYSAIPSYVDFHYSIEGQYIELSQAALTALQLDMGSAMQEHLFDGLDDRLFKSAEFLDTEYNAILERNILDLLEAAAPENLRHLPLGPVAQMGIDDALERAIVTQPIALSAAGLISSTRTAIAQKIADAIISKLARNAASKGLTKSAQLGTSAMLGGGAGATAGLACGPGAPFCSAVAGGVTATVMFIGTWILVDHVVIKLDELLNRNEFEESIRNLVSEHRTQMRQNMINLLKAKTAAIEESVPLHAFYD